MLKKYINKNLQEVVKQNLSETEINELNKLLEKVEAGASKTRKELHNLLSDLEFTSLINQYQHKVNENNIDLNVKEVVDNLRLRNYSFNEIEDIINRIIIDSKLK